MATTKRTPRAETFRAAKERLGRLERLNIGFIRATFRFRWADRLFLWCQRTIGQGWVNYCTQNLVHVHGLERLGRIDTDRSIILVSNHRSFFDLFVVNALLYKHGFRQRFLFPVRATFFYDHPLGWFVNGIMSFFSMYPPIFRDRKRLTLNHTALSELSQALQNEGRSAGMHPEGTRNKSDDPYTFLPAQSGVGRLIHLTHAPVWPVFINGLGNDLVKQVAGNFNGKGPPVVVVFGAPIDFGSLLDEPANTPTYKRIAEQVMTSISELGEQERAIRAELEGRIPNPSQEPMEPPQESAS